MAHEREVDVNGFKGAGMMRGGRAAAWLAPVLLALAVSGCGPRNPSLSEQRQDVCPVMGVATESNHYVDYQGKRIFFCCDNCAETFTANAEKYLKEMERKRVHLMPTPPIPPTPVLQSGHSCACVPGTKRPHLEQIKAEFCFWRPPVTSIPVFKMETPSRSEEMLVKQTSPDRAPPFLPSQSV